MPRRCRPRTRHCKPRSNSTTGNSLSDLEFKTACDALARGGVIAYPTEAVWGLGCDPANADAVQRILKLKNRPAAKGLIVVAADMDQVADLLEPLDTTQLDQLRATWPGPVTWIIPDPRGVFSHWVKGEHPSIAVRVSAHPVVQQLCLEFGGPIVSTSANIAGQAEIRDRSELVVTFAEIIDCIVPGELGSAATVSEIRDLVTGAKLR